MFFHLQCLCCVRACMLVSYPALILAAEDDYIIDLLSMITSPLQVGATPVTSVHCNCVIVRARFSNVGFDAIILKACDIPPLGKISIKP